MKKVIRSVFLLILVFSLALAVVPSASAASKLQTNKSTVYRFLTNTLKLNRAAACGIMANIEKESNFNPELVHVDSNGLLSGGLCQWNGSRFSSLKNFCSKNGYSYLSVTGQMNYLKKELTGGYRGILNYIKGVSNTAQGAYNAGHYWCYYFEVPANRSSKAVTRGNLAKTYFNSFTPIGGVKEVSVSTNAVKGSVPFLSSLKISWTSGGENCTGYIIEVAKKAGENYKWSEASSAYTTSNSFTFSAYELGIGKFAVRVTARSDSESKVSSIVKVNINCEDHLYSSKVKKNATATESGVRTYTCVHCGEKLSKKISAGKLPSGASLSAPKVSAERKTYATKLTYSSVKNASGYIIYGIYGGQWIRLAVMPSSTTHCMLPEVYSGTKLAVIAFRTVGSKTIKSAAAPVKVK